MAYQKIIVALLFLLLTNICKAQTSIGVEAGISSSYLNTNISNRVSTSINYAVGYTVTVPIQYKIKDWFYVETAPGITQKNYSIDRTDSFAGIYESFVNTYLQLPVMAKFVYGKRLQVFADAGFYYGYWLSGRVKGVVPNIFDITNNGNIGLNNYDEKYQFNPQTDNRNEFGWIAGIGAQYRVNKKYQLTFSCRDYQSLTDQQKKYTVNEIPQYNQTFTFSIGVLVAFK